MSAVVTGSWYSGVIRRNHRRRQVKEGRACVGNTIDRGAGESTASDSIAIAGKLPKAIRLVDGDVRDGTRVFAGIDEAEVIGTWSALPEVHRKQRSAEGRFGVGEECFLLDRSDGITDVERKPDETIIVDILLKLATDTACKLDCLVCDCGSTDLHGVCVDIPTCRAAITVGNAPSVSVELSGGNGFRRIII